MTETRSTDTGPMCSGQVVQNIRYSVPITCVDNWCYYRKATEVRIKPGISSACSHVSIFSSDRRLYTYKITSTLTFCDAHHYLYKHFTTNSHHRLLNIAVCDNAINFSFDDNSIKRNGRSLQHICTSNHKLSAVDLAQHKYQSLPLEMTLSYSH
jgi:hypothetical protein